MKKQRWNVGPLCQVKKRLGGRCTVGGRCLGAVLRDGLCGFQRCVFPCGACAPSPGGSLRESTQTRRAPRTCPVRCPQRSPRWETQAQGVLWVSLRPLTNDSGPRLVAKMCAPVRASTCHPGGGGLRPLLQACPFPAPLTKPSYAPLHHRRTQQAGSRITELSPKLSLTGSLSSWRSRPNVTSLTSLSGVSTMSFSLCTPPASPSSFIGP